MAFNVEENQITRYSEELVNSTLKQALMVYLDFPSSGISLMSPEELFVNDRNETIGNRQETRYPKLSILPNDVAEFRKRLTSPIRQQDSTTATGYVRIYDSYYDVNQMYTICMQTTTKREHRRYKEKIRQFFLKYDYGIEIYNDTLPEYNETINFTLVDESQMYLDAPYDSIFEVKVNYKLFDEYLAYLMHDWVISGKIYREGTYDESPSGFIISGSI